MPKVLKVTVPPRSITTVRGTRLSLACDDSSCPDGGGNGEPTLACPKSITALDPVPPCEAAPPATTSLEIPLGETDEGCEHVTATSTTGKSNDKTIRLVVIV